MAELSKIKLNGTEYDLKDIIARNNFNNYYTSSEIDDNYYTSDQIDNLINTLVQSQDARISWHGFDEQ